MPDANPYSTPVPTSEPSIEEGPSTRRLWIAYSIAPIVAPVLAAIAAFVTGLFYLATHPEDTGTPIGVVVLPIMILVVGVPAAYAVVGVIGMPVAFLLRRRNRLNAITIHSGALLCAVSLALTLTVVGLMMAWANDQELPNILELLKGGAILFLATAPFITLSATTFWLIGVPRRRRS